MVAVVVVEKGAKFFGKLMSKSTQRNMCFVNGLSISSLFEWQTVGFWGP